MERSINAIIKTKCFNCKDKGSVVIINKESRGKAVLIPCPICKPNVPEVKQDSHPEEHF